MNIQFKMIVRFTVLFVCFIFSLYCSESKEDETNSIEGDSLELDYSMHKLPNNIKWMTNNSFKTFASPNAKKGGIFRAYIIGFPLTFRTVGPDSNNSTRSYFLNNQMSLLSVHPNTEEALPSIASHWAYDNDGKTMYFRIDKRARWSDGAPVTADDFIYTLEFMRSKHINAPWYNDYYSKEIDKVIKYDDHIISVSASKTIPDLWLTVSISPTPKHFYGKLNKEFVKEYNWKIEPNTGPYILSKFIKGKYLLFERKKNWWAKDLRFHRNRHNVDKFKIIVIRDDNIAFEHFKKGKIDTYRAVFPIIWHNKGKGKLFEKGYIQKIWFYNDTRQPTYGFRLNLDKEIFTDINIRYAFAHAINFDKLNKKVLRGDYERLHSFYTGFGEYTNKNIRARRYNIKEVERYMKSSGWERGKDGIWTKGNRRYSVTLTYGSPLYNPRMVVLQEEAKKAGIELKLELLDPSSSYKKVMEKKHEVNFSGFGGGGLRPSPWQSFHSENAHKPQTNNHTNTDDPEMDKLIDYYRNSISSKERIKLSHKIQKRIHDISAWIPLYQVPYTRHFYWRWMKLPKVAGTKNSSSLFTDPAGAGLFWIDEDVKEETIKALKAEKSFKPVTIIDKTFKN
ncbi:MAG: extracellular solute-binding protein [Spirochaetota bacterium]|nr:extracellular solute-binding protein [Spirochaetota bacterium]